MPRYCPEERLDLDSVAAVILAGGQGMRLMPLTQRRCKPGVSFGGRYRLIDIPLSNSLNSGISNLFVISQFYASHLQEHILATYHLDLFRTGGIELLCPQETPEGKQWFQGTADAVRKNIEILLQKPFEYFLILAGDQLYNMNFDDMIGFARKEEADLVIAALPVEEEEARRMGLLQIDDHKNVTNFYEKPSDLDTLRSFQFSTTGAKKWLGSMGIYVFKRSALIELLKCPGDDFGHDLIPKHLSIGKTKSYLYHNYWEDIGTVLSFYNANLALLDGKNCLDLYDDMHPIYTRSYNLPSPWIKDVAIRNSLISQGSILEAKEIHHSVVGICCRIKKGTVIRNTIMLGNHFHSSHLDACSIGENCVIEKAILDEEIAIGNNVVLTNIKQLSRFDGDGVYIRDGIIIVSTGTKIPDGFTL